MKTTTSGVYTPGTPKRTLTAEYTTNAGGYNMVAALTYRGRVLHMIPVPEQPHLAKNTVQAVYAWARENGYTHVKWEG